METPDTTTPDPASGPSPPSTACDGVDVACTQVAKKQRLDAAVTDKDIPKLYPTGQFPRDVGKDMQDCLTICFLYQANDNQPLFKVFVDMDPEGRLWSMDGDNLEISCPSWLCKFLRVCVDEDNPMITIWKNQGPLQNEVHDEIWEHIKRKAKKKRERLNNKMLETTLRDLYNELSGKYKPFDFCDKAWAQDHDIMLHVHEPQPHRPPPRRAYNHGTP
jgi:hypothetical protein